MIALLPIVAFLGAVAGLGDLRTPAQSDLLLPVFGGRFHIRRR